MHCTDARAGEHGDSRFGYHRQVQRNAIAFLYAARFQDVGEFANFFVEFAVGDFAIFIRAVAFPDDGDLIGAGFEVAIEAVVGNVKLGALEPVDVEIFLIKTPVEDRIPGLEPADVLFSLFGPKAVRIFH